MADDTDAPSKKGRDPILMIGTIVLLLAFVVVISGYVIAEFQSEPKVPAEYGNKVKVDYIGSYYGWYDEEGAVVFDTSMWSIANDDNIAKSWEFTKRAESQYVPFNVTIGSGGALADFENILIGMKPGETARISIENAYGIVPDAKFNTWNMSTVSAAPTDPLQPFSLTETMSVDMYKATFGVDTVVPGPQPELKHPYGWMSSAFCSTTGIVTVTHIVTDVTTDDANVYKNVDGSITATVTNLTATTFDVTFAFPDYVEGKLIKFQHGGQSFFVTSVDTVAGTFTTKSTEERVGMTLYFVITFVDYQ